MRLQSSCKVLLTRSQGADFDKGKAAMLDMESQTDAISGRRRAGVKALAGQLLGVMLVSLLLVMTIAVLF